MADTEHTAADQLGSTQPADEQDSYDDTIATPEETVSDNADPNPADPTPEFDTPPAGTAAAAESAIDAEDNALRADGSPARDKGTTD